MEDFRVNLVFIIFLWFLTEILQLKRLKCSTAVRFKKKNANCSIQLQVMVRFICVPLSRMLSWPDSCTKRKCEHSERARSFKQGWDLSQRFQSALALSLPAGVHLPKSCIYLQTHCGLGCDAFESAGIYVQNISTAFSLKLSSSLAQTLVLVMTD